ncbi:MAG TPA: amidohydrolase family protein, partial [Caldimonas sp.]|nr:amidohydrolase family protein [Caldimonas sp.]
NSAMLKLAGIDRDTEVEGVVRFAGGARAGEPNGELQEPAAMFLVLRKIGNAGLLGPMTVPGIRSFARLASMQGVTTATDLVNKLSDDDVRVLEQATGDDDCSVRILPAFQAFHGTHGAPDGAEHVKSLVGRNTERLRYGLVKMMLDGSIQGFSSRMRWPGHFNGAPNGIWVTAPAQYEADFETYHRAGLTIHTHTNADEASLVAIAAIERVLARAPRPDHRHTLQHGQMIDAAMFRRMKALGLCANLFANHIWYWGDQHYEMTMGPDRAHRMDACASALAAGVPLAIHSDAPVTPLGPLHVAWCAVNRVTPKGRLLGESERLTVMQALHAITLGPAWTLKMDHEIGSIECGKRADFCVLDEDPLDVEPMRLKDLRIRGTMLSGRVFEQA